MAIALSLDFVSDVLEDGRRFRVLVVVDAFTRECLALVIDTSLSGQRVARELDRLAELRGRPLTIVSDNGTELTPAFAGAGSRMPSCAGRTNAASIGTTSPRESPSRTASSKA